MTEQDGTVDDQWEAEAAEGDHRHDVELAGD